jgi:hypothetical protein
MRGTIAAVRHRRIHSFQSCTIVFECRAAIFELRSAMFELGTNPHTG